MSKIAVIGAGNVATHLAMHLHQAGHIITQIFSRSHINAAQLAPLVHAQPISSLTDIQTDVDFILVAVKDDAVAEIANQINQSKAIVAHTSGSAGIAAVSSHSEHGVFYPLQTFSKSKPVNIKKVPFFIEGNNTASQDALIELATSISNTVQSITSEQLKHIHLAAVFACNFSNHMFSIAHNILAEQNVDFNVLAPLISETVNKALQGNPLKAQTGPAARNDKQTMQAQLDKLPSSGLSKEIYELVSKSIIESLNQ